MASVVGQVGEGRLGWRIPESLFSACGAPRGQRQSAVCLAPVPAEQVCLSCWALTSEAVFCGEETPLRQSACSDGVTVMWQ